MSLRMERSEVKQSQGNLLLSDDERSEKESQRTERLIAQLRSLGVEPDV